MAELAAEFVPLDRRRRLGDPPLGAAERERWADLRDRLAHEFGYPLPIGPSRPARHLRVPAGLKVRIGAEGEVATLENLSEGGLFVCCQRPLTPGTALRISIESELLDEPLEVDALVVHSRTVANRDGPAGFGALLTGLAPEDAQAIGDLVEGELTSAVQAR
jgi:Tfp pilus assembly protein PilZ